MELSVLVSCFCCKLVPQTWWLKTIQIYYNLLSYSSGSQKFKNGSYRLYNQSISRQYSIFSEGARGESVPCLLQLLGAPAFLGSWPLQQWHHPNLCFCHFISFRFWPSCVPLTRILVITLSLHGWSFQQMMLEQLDIHMQKKANLTYTLYKN